MKGWLTNMEENKSLAPVQPQMLQMASTTAIQGWYNDFVKLSKEILKGGNNHKDYLNDLFSKEKDLNKIKKEIENLLSNKQYTKDINDLILKLNTFLNLTGKSAHISEDGFIFLKEGEKTVNWYQCSKGEKNLIVLIVLAFLNKNNNTIFIVFCYI